MYKDYSGILSLVINYFGITNTSVKYFAVRISSVKIVPKCLPKLIFREQYLRLYNLYRVLTPCDNHFSKILQNCCDIVSNRYFCTLTCNEALYTVIMDIIICTQTKVKQHHIFFGDTVLEVVERNTWVMEIKYFEFYCKFYHFYEHFELKMIL